MTAASEPDDTGRTPSARVSLEVRILDADVSSRQVASDASGVVDSSGASALVVVLATDPDLRDYLCTHLESPGAWRVARADGVRHAATLLAQMYATAHTSKHAPGRTVLVIEGAHAGMLDHAIAGLLDTAYIVLLADAFPTGFTVRAERHALVPWPLDVPLLVQRVTQFVNPV